MQELKQDAAAQYALGKMFEGGKGVTKDMEAAVKLFQRAAAENYASAQRHLVQYPELPCP